MRTIHIRQSDLSSFQRCAQQQYLYDQQEAGTGKRGQTLSATVFGTVMHYAVMVMEKAHHEGNPQALELGLATFTHYWMPENVTDLEPQGIDVWLPRQTYGGMRERGLRSLRDYYSVLVKDDGILLALEHTFSVPIEIDGEEHWLDGTADRLAIRIYQGKTPYLSVEDFKTGKKPTYLQFATQWTVYSFASQFAWFWDGFDSDEFEDLLRRLVTRKLDLFLTPDHFPLIPRRGRWLSLGMEGFSISDCGWRTEQHYARLKVQLREYIKARSLDVHPLTVDGHICMYCPFSRNGACGGVPIPDLDEGRPR